MKRLKSSDACTKGSIVCFTAKYIRADIKAPVLEVSGGNNIWYRSDQESLQETISLSFIDPFDKCSKDFIVSNS